MFTNLNTNVFLVVFRHIVHVALFVAKKVNFGIYKFVCLQYDYKFGKKVLLGLYGCRIRAVRTGVKNPPLRARRQYVQAGRTGAKMTPVLTVDTYGPYVRVVRIPPVNFAGMQQSSRIFIGRGGGTRCNSNYLMATRIGRVEAPQAPRGGCELGKGLCCSTTRADYIDKII